MEKPKTNDELRARLREKVPEALEAEMNFDSAIMRVLASKPKEEKKVLMSRKAKTKERLKRKAS